MIDENNYSVNLQKCLDHFNIEEELMLKKTQKKRSQINVIDEDSND